MPAMTETAADVVASCRYIYNHAPRILGAGAAQFLNSAKRRSSLTEVRKPGAGGLVARRG